MVYHLLCGLHSRSEVEVECIVLNDGLLAWKLQEAGIPCQVFDESKLTFIQITKLLVSEIRAKKPKIIHSHRYKENLLISIASWFANERISLVTTQHGMPEIFGASGNVRRRFMALVNQWVLQRRFDKIVAVSGDIFRALSGISGMRDDRVCTIHNGIEISVNSRLEKRNHDVSIGSAGRFFPVKNYPFMVEIALEVLQSSPSVTFHLAGDGPQFEAIQAAIRRHGIDAQFKLAGFVEDMGTFYENLDVYLSTSVHEGLPMSVLEAMANGLPVVAPLVGGFEEIITDGVEGFLIPPTEPATFAARCLELCGSRDLRRKMGLAARKRVVEHFSMDKMVVEYTDMYQRVTAGSRQR